MVASVSGAIVLARGGRLGRHLIVERCGSYGAPVKERRTGRCNADVFFVSISRRARARRKSFRLHERTVFTSATLSGALRMDPASLPPRRDLLGLGPSPVLRSTWQWIAFPRDPTGALRARRHSCSDPGELDHLPWVFSPGAPSLVGVGLPGARGSGPAATPVLSTDVCCSRMLFSKTIAPRLGSRRIAMFPHDARACGFTPQCPLRRTVGSRPGCCLPQSADPPAYL
jgi:hypothetical protein